MIPLYSKEEYISAKSNQKLPLKCYQCNNKFLFEKKYIDYSFKTNALKENNKGKYCSRKCFVESKSKSIDLYCSNCNIAIKKTPWEIKKIKSNSFCSKSCAAIYNNCNKVTGSRRSKLEYWIEEQLKQRYNNLVMLFNDKKAVGSELDIYIPLLKTGFELNGIFHYKPIYGKKKFLSTQANDLKKKESCDRLNIELHVIDVSDQLIFSPEKSKGYLQHICNIIDCKYPSLK